MSEPKTISRRLYMCLLDSHRNLRKFLLGRLLTITDSTGRDDVQRKALKNLIENEVWHHSEDQEISFSHLCRYLAMALKEPKEHIPSRDAPEIEVEKEKIFNPLTD